MALEEPASEGSSRASEKAKVEPVEDDDLYCLQSTFVYFQVCRCFIPIDNTDTDESVSHLI